MGVSCDISQESYVFVPGRRYQLFGVSLLTRTFLLHSSGYVEAKDERQEASRTTQTKEERE